MMRMSGNTVLITGGSSGIGFALAEAFLEQGNDVIICGRREEMLLEARKKHPNLFVKVCDVGDENDRKSLVSWVSANFSKLNILINNAGIQRDIDFTKGEQDLRDLDEIRINFEAPVFLSAYFIPLLKEQKNAAIINVSSVLAFAPMSRVPVYCATKAAIHNFCLSLRHQLSGTGIKVFELMPPRVRTELNSEGRRKSGYADSGIKAEEFAEAVMKGLQNDEFEIEFEPMGVVRKESRAELDKRFESINNRTFQWDS